MIWKTWKRENSCSHEEEEEMDAKEDKGVKENRIVWKRERKAGWITPESGWMRILRKCSMES